MVKSHGVGYHGHVTYLTTEHRGRQLARVAHHHHSVRVELEGDQSARLHRLGGLVNDHCVELEPGDLHHHLQDGLRTGSGQRRTHHIRLFQNGFFQFSDGKIATVSDPSSGAGNHPGFSFFVREIIYRGVYGKGRRG